MCRPQENARRCGIFPAAGDEGDEGELIGHQQRAPGDHARTGVLVRYASGCDRLIHPPGSFDAERQELLEALRACGGNQSEAARRLGVSRVTIWNRCKRLKVDPKSLA